MKKFLPIVIVILMFIMCGCGSKNIFSDPTKPHDEKSIMTDIADSRFFKDNYPSMDITSLKIIKRQTDAEDKYDKVWITLNCKNKNGSSEGYIDLLVQYSLYNDGWLIDECDYYDNGRQSSKFSPLQGYTPDIEELTQYMFRYENIANVEVIDNKWNQGEYVTYTTVGFTAEHTNVSYTVEMEIPNFFDDFYGVWFVRDDLIKENKQGDWHFAGRYSFYMDGIEIGSGGRIIQTSTRCEVDIGESNPSDITSFDYITFDDFGDEIYEAKEISRIFKTSDISFEDLASEYLGGEKVSEEGYTVKFGLDYEGANYYDFDYVLLFKSGLQGRNNALFIGRNNLAFYDMRERHSDYKSKTVTLDLHYMDLEFRRTNSSDSTLNITTSDGQEDNTVYDADNELKYTLTNKEFFMILLDEVDEYEYIATHIYFADDYSGRVYTTNVENSGIIYTTLDDINISWSLSGINLSITFVEGEEEYTVSWEILYSDPSKGVFAAGSYDGFAAPLFLFEDEETKNRVATALLNNLESSDYTFPEKERFVEWFEDEILKNS